MFVLMFICSQGGVSQYAPEQGMWTREVWIWEGWCTDGGVDRGGGGMCVDGGWGVYTPPPVMATAASGTHPTGMHTCS